MEAIYEPERFKASEIINLKDHFTQYLSLIEDDIAKIAKDGDEAENEKTNLMGIEVDSTQMVTLEETCSLDELLCEGELKMAPKDVPENFTLRSIIPEVLPFSQKCSDLEVIRIKDQIEQQRNCEKIILMNKENFHHSIVEKDHEKKLIEDLVPGSDFLMKVIFYRPFKFDYQTRNSRLKCRFSHEIDMLGNNSLTELRDKIFCYLDSGLQKEVNGPDADISHLLNAKDEYPSGCFVINNVCYNDMRSPNAIEYSKEIEDWGQKRLGGNFTKADMQATKLRDLSLRFGYPYVYIHHGECEHVMVFADAHILTNRDCLNSKQYPRLAALNKPIATVCYMCNNAPSKWVIKDCDKLPQSTTYLCMFCARCYCSKNGEKLGEYKIYPVFHC